jgi:hypothetical protein
MVDADRQASMERLAIHEVSKSMRALNEVIDSIRSITINTSIDLTLDIFNALGLTLPTTSASLSCSITSRLIGLLDALTVSILATEKVEVSIYIYIQV